MNPESLLVMTPTRGRKEECARLIASFEKNTIRDSTEMICITDADDDSYKEMDWGAATNAVLNPRDSISGILNRTADTFVDDYDALMLICDDHVIETSGWDEILIQALADIGGSGFVYPDDRRRSDIPEVVLISSDVVKELGHFAEPAFGHFCIDNVWADLGRRAQIIRYCPDVIIRHLHYSVDPDVEHDATYVEAEEKFGESDRGAYAQWVNVVAPHQVARLRRNFNPDIKWLFGKI